MLALPLRNPSLRLAVGRPGIRYLTIDGVPGVKPEASKEQEVKFLQPPKRPLNMYQLVRRDMIAEEKNPASEIKIWDYARLASEKCRSLSDAEKKSYQAEVDRRREVYEKEMHEFLDTLTPQDYAFRNEYIRYCQEQGLPASRHGIPKVDPRAPKQPPGGFAQFCGDVRADPTKFPGFTGFLKPCSNAVDIKTKILAGYWKEMDEDIKEKYSLQARRLRRIYEQEKAEYALRFKTEASKEEAKSPLPPKRPLSMYHLVLRDMFVANNKATSSKLTPRDCVRLASKKCRSLSDEEKKSYQAEMDRHRQVYEQEMRTYLVPFTPQKCSP